MTGSHSTRVVCVASDRTRRAQIGRAMRDAGFSVTEVSNPEDAVEFTHHASPALVLRDGNPPSFHVLSEPGGTSDATGAPGQIELLLCDRAGPAELVNVAYALLQLSESGAKFRVVDARGARRASDARQTRSSNRKALAALCHDLRTPLSAMAGRLFLMQGGKLDEADTKRAIEKLQGNVMEQLQLIDRALVALRPEPD